MHDSHVKTSFLKLPKTCHEPAEAMFHRKRSLFMPRIDHSKTVSKLTKRDNPWLKLNFLVICGVVVATITVQHRTTCSDRSSKKRDNLMLCFERNFQLLTTHQLMAWRHHKMRHTKLQNTKPFVSLSFFSSFNPHSVTLFYFLSLWVARDGSKGRNSKCKQWSYTQAIISVSAFLKCFFCSSENNNNNREVDKKRRDTCWVRIDKKNRQIKSRFVISLVTTKTSNGRDQPTHDGTGISGVAFGLVHKSCKMYRSPNGLVKFKLGGGGLATLSTTKLYGKSWWLIIAQT